MVETAAQHLARLCAEARADVAAGRLSKTVEEVALHEAGHAIVARVAGIPVEALTIIPDGDRLGHLDPGQGATGPRIGYAAMCWAGAIAAGRLIGASEDLERIRAVNPRWLRATGPDTPFWLARGVLAEHWADLEQVAAALLARGRLDGAEVTALLG